ncbi:cadherin-86C [Culicoides brevitarsis]|uniref:cadherin-86C n=1 Tax=Culicoides brevitarsis TaxID=469753 RepID=UPI00307BE07B
MYLEKYKISNLMLIIVSIILFPISNIVCMNPKFDASTEMRLVLVPADANVGTVIYRLRATDEEFDYPLIFELVGESSIQSFQIESLPCTKYNSVCQANVILKRRLEPGRYYDFHVGVRDTRGGTAIIMCSVTATNFTTPHEVIFPHKPGILMVPENAKRGLELDYVVARKNPLYQKPVYLELWGSPLFAIRQKIVSSEMTEGTIFLLGPLDFEKQSMYHLTLLANDAYAEPGQDSRNIAGIEIVVIVEDIQDEPPIFTFAPPVTRLPSSLLPGDKILQVHAEDGDKGVPRQVRYGLVSEGNPFTLFFGINETTGEIKLVKSLDEISALTHFGDPVLLTVIAEEIKVARNEPPAMSSTVQLALLLPERSNSPPYFDNDHYVARIDENAQSGTTLIFPDPYVSRVSDDDSGKNGVFSLTLLNNNGTFEISPNVAERRTNFVIRVRDNQKLDFEMHHMLIFQIFAQELGPSTNLSATANVTVYINDVNDNSPMFEQNEYKLQLPENVTAGTRVIQVHAEDVDTLKGGRIRYTQILGYLNSSLNLDPVSGVITIATNNHGFDRELMPEYHFYVVAQDNDGIGNRVEVPLIIQVLDINDETPTFEKTLYEFILTPDMQDFTIPAFIKATDKDAEPPNNVVRYEIIHGNYENKVVLNEFTGRLTLREPLGDINLNRRKRRQSIKPKQNENDIFVLTARAFDLGVPVRWSTCTLRIYPPESKQRTVTFVVPGKNPDKQRTEDTLVTITGGRVVIQDMRPYTGQNIPPSQNLGGDSKDKTLVIATVLYDSNSVVDLQEIQNKISKNGTYQGIIIRDDSAANIYRAENKVLFWLLMLFSLLLALGVLVLLLCCVCSWCPLYAASRWQSGWEENMPGRQAVQPIPVQNLHIGNLQEEETMTKN